MVEGRMTAAARVAFGVSAVAFAAVSFAWRDADMWQRLQPLHAAGTIAGWCLLAALLAGGVALLLPRSLRLGALLAGGVFGVYVLACAGSIIAAPRDPGGYINGFEQLAIVCGALAVFAMTDRNGARALALARIARLALAACALSFAWAQVLYLQYTASLVPAWIPPNPVFLTNLTTGAFALAALAMLVNRRARLAMRLLAVMIASFGVLVWVPIIAAHPAALANWSEIGENYLIAAAAWLVSDASGSAAES